jgi:hypothetical protein
MALGLCLVAAGLICVAVDMPGNKVRLVLPDPLGYVLMAIGLWPLWHLGGRFRVALVTALAMVPIAVVMIVDHKEYVGDYGQLPYYWDPFWPLALAEMLGNIVIVYCFMTGLERRAIGRARFSIATPAQTAMAVYVSMGLFKLLFKGVAIIGVASGALFATRLEYYVVIPLALFEFLSIVLVAESLLDAARRRKQFLIPRD